VGCVGASSPLVFVFVVLVVARLDRPCSIIESFSVMPVGLYLYSVSQSYIGYVSHDSIYARTGCPILWYSHQITEQMKQRTTDGRSFSCVFKSTTK
jgi:hypothetical protein